MLPFTRKFTTTREAWHVHGHTEALTAEGFANSFLLGNAFSGRTLVSESPAVCPSATQ